MDATDMEFKSGFKLSLISLCVLAPGLVFAKTCSSTSFCGWSVGIGLGATTFMTDINANATMNDPEAFVPPIIDLALAPAPVIEKNIMTHDINGDIYRYGIMGALFVGYGQIYTNNTYIGAELGLNFFGARSTSLKGSTSNNQYVSSSQRNAQVQFGDVAISQQISTNTRVTRNAIEPFLDLKLGYLITPTTLGYLRGGLNYNTIQIKNNAAYSVIVDPSTSFRPTPPPGSIGADHSHSRTGFNWRAGAGVEVLVTPDVGLGVDYVYTFYRNVTSNTTGSGNDIACDTLEGCIQVPATLTSSSKATVSDQEVMAQLIYHFG